MMQIKMQNEAFFPLCFYFPSLHSRASFLFPAPHSKTCRFPPRSYLVLPPFLFLCSEGGSMFGEMIRKKRKKEQSLGSFMAKFPPACCFLQLMDEFNVLISAENYWKHSVCAGACLCVCCCCCRRRRNLFSPHRCITCCSAGLFAGPL